MSKILRRVSAEQFAWTEREFERAVSAESVRALKTRNRVVGMTIEKIAIGCGDTSTRRRVAGHSGRAAPGPRRLVSNAVPRPHGELRLHRMVGGVIGIVSHLHR